MAKRPSMTELSVMASTSKRSKPTADHLTPATLSSFEELPAELSDAIYHYVVCAEDTAYINGDGTIRTSLHPLAFVSKTIRYGFISFCRDNLRCYATRYHIYTTNFALPTIMCSCTDSLEKYSPVAATRFHYHLTQPLDVASGAMAQSLNGVARPWLENRRELEFSVSLGLSSYELARLQHMLVVFPMSGSKPSTTVPRWAKNSGAWAVWKLFMDALKSAVQSPTGVGRVVRSSY